MATMSAVMIRPVPNFQSGIGVQLMGSRSTTGWRSGARLVHFPTLVKREHREMLQREIPGANRQRMLREIGDALDTIARADRPRAFLSVSSRRGNTFLPLKRFLVGSKLTYQLLRAEWQLRELLGIQAHMGGARGYQRRSVRLATRQPWFMRAESIADKGRSKEWL